MSRLFHVLTEFETLLAVRPDGRLVHAPDGEPGLAPVVAEVAEGARGLWLLRSGPGGTPIVLDGPHPVADGVLAVIATDQMSGVRLRMPLGGAEIVAARSAGEAGGMIGWGDGGTTVRRRPIGLADDKPATSLDLAFAIEILGAADRGRLLLAAALLHCLPFAQMRQAWEAVVDRFYHDALFAIVHERARVELGTFAGYTAAILAADIARHGWSIGERTYGRPLVIEAGRGRLTIGRYCALADPTIVLANHQIRAASTYPFMDLWAEWPGTRIGLSDHVNGDVVIGNDVWVGVGAVILPGAIVGDGALIGAGAVVRGKVAPYAICVGNPGEIKGYRFEPDIVRRLLAVAWWNWPEAVVSRYIPLLVGPSIIDFLEAAEEEFAPALNAGTGPGRA